MMFSFIFHKGEFVLDDSIKIAFQYGFENKSEVNLKLGISNLGGNLYIFKNIISYSKGVISVIVNEKPVKEIVAAKINIELPILPNTTQFIIIQLKVKDEIDSLINLERLYQQKEHLDFFFR
jgi:hypothetical protein